MFEVLNYRGIAPHPVLLPMGEGTPELAAEREAPFPLPMGEGGDEGCELWA